MDADSVGALACDKGYCDHVAAADDAAPAGIAALTMPAFHGSHGPWLKPDEPNTGVVNDCTWLPRQDATSDPVPDEAVLATEACPEEICRLIASVGRGRALACCSPCAP